MAQILISDLLLVKSLTNIICVNYKTTMWLHVAKLSCGYGFLLELLLHFKLSLHQEGLANLHEFIPHPDHNMAIRFKKKSPLMN